MLGKTFKGLTDEMLRWQTEQFLKIEVARDSYTVYLEPKIVAEIAFNEIQVSPRYTSGLALRIAACTCSFSISSSLISLFSAASCPPPPFCPNN